MIYTSEGLFLDKFHATPRSCLSAYLWEENFWYTYTHVHIHIHVLYMGKASLEVFSFLTEPLIPDNPPLSLGKLGRLFYQSLPRRIINFEEGQAREIFEQLDGRNSSRAHPLLYSVSSVLTRIWRDFSVENCKRRVRGYF